MNSDEKLFPTRREKRRSEEREKKNVFRVYNPNTASGHISLSRERPFLLLHFRVFTRALSVCARERERERERRSSFSGSSVTLLFLLPYLLVGGGVEHRRESLHVVFSLR